VAHVVLSILDGVQSPSITSRGFAFYIAIFHYHIVAQPLFISLFVSGDRHHGDQHQRQQTMRANHAAFDPIFIQYIIIIDCGR
jgi:hypothetical protein